MKKAIVFLADGFEEIEAITVIDYLRRASVDVKTVAVPSDSMIELNMAEGSHCVKVKTDLTFTQFEEDYRENLPDLVYTPGGMPGSTNLGKCEPVLNFIKKCFSAGKYVSAICAAPAVVLAKTGILKGKNWTCYPGMENGIEKFCFAGEDLNECLKGSNLKTGVPFVVDGTVITGRGPGTAEEFAMELVKLLTDYETYNSIKAGSIQR